MGTLELGLCGIIGQSGHPGPSVQCPIYPGNSHVKTPQFPPIQILLLTMTIRQSYYYAQFTYTEPV